MAYDKTKLIMQDQAITGRREFIYDSPDPIATVTGAGYIANAADMGMKVDDWVRFTDTNLHKVYALSVGSITAGAATLLPAAGVAVGG